MRVALLRGALLALQSTAHRLDIRVGFEHPRHALGTDERVGRDGVTLLGRAVIHAVAVDLAVT